MSESEIFHTFCFCWLIFSCPFDSVEVYDGSSEGSPLIKKFCGIYKNNTIIYSSKKDLYIKFNTASGRIDFQTDSLYDNVDFTSDRRGFNITYEFSDSLVLIGKYLIIGVIPPDGSLCDLEYQRAFHYLLEQILVKKRPRWPSGLKCILWDQNVSDQQEFNSTLGPIL